MKNNNRRIKQLEKQITIYSKQIKELSSKIPFEENDNIYRYLLDLHFRIKTITENKSCLRNKIKKLKKNLV